MSRLVAALILLVCGSAHAFEVRVASGQPVRVSPGEQVVFVVEVTRPINSPESDARGSFVDPSIGWDVRSDLPFGVGQIQDGRCNLGFSFDFTPAPNFLGFFGAEDLLPGETLTCRVVIGASPQARPGRYRAGLSLDQLTEFEVIIGVGPARPVPIGTEWWMRGLLVALLLIAAGYRRKASS